jgi:hypothetical protein
MEMEMPMPRYRGLRSVLVKKDALVEELTTNREKHLKEFEDLEAEYKRAVEVALTEAMETFGMDGTVPERDFISRLPVPRSHTEDYDAALKMMEMSQDTELELSENEFQTYVMDNWDWKREFAGASAFYMAESSKFPDRA